ncbi:MAG TPA: aspartate carbamoyltransferase catalytic subunit [Candidatus Limnocylindria bacterium]|nr:aspartate carbamoyltransferase catalytic subunit [Candidatus Limnocylindria bacterium]
MSVATAAETRRHGSGWPRHLLDVNDLSDEALERILRRAETHRAGLDRRHAPEQELSRRRVALLFAEPSTRTRLSFEIAARNLGAEVLVLEPGASSLVKGESLADTARTLDALGADFLVLRHHRSGAPWVAARHFSRSVVNAGDGWHAHPTQALLDLFTLRRALGTHDLRGRKIAIVGDLRHSRVARSNAWTLTCAGADVWACAPPELLRGFESLAEELPADRRLTLTDQLPAALADADAVMALRMQFERMSRRQPSRAEYVTRYQIDERRLAGAAPGAFLLHPGPVNEGIEVTREVARGPRSLVLEQVRNGVPLRMAVLGGLLPDAQDIREGFSARR